MRKALIVLAVLSHFMLQNADAGVLHMSGEEVLSENDVRFLEHLTAAKPFDAFVVIKRDMPCGGELEKELESRIKSPRSIAIGIGKNCTATRYGKGLHIPSSTWELINSAGNNDFRKGKWTLGLAAIMFRAALNIGKEDPKTPFLSDHAAEAWLFGFLALMSFGMLLYWWAQHRKAKRLAKERQQREEREAAEAEIAREREREAKRLEEQNQRREEEQKELDRQDWESDPTSSFPAHYALGQGEYRAQRRALPPYVPPAVRPTSDGTPIERFVEPLTTRAKITNAGPPPVVMIRGDDGNGLLTGMLINEALHDHGHHEEHHHHHHSDPVIVQTIPPVIEDSEPTWKSDGGTIRPFEELKEPDDDFSSGGTASSWSSPSVSSETEEDSGNSDGGTTSSHDDSTNSSDDSDSDGGTSSDWGSSDSSSNDSSSSDSSSSDSDSSGD